MIQRYDADNVRPHEDGGMMKYTDHLAVLAEKEETIRSLLVTLDISTQQRADEGLKAEEEIATLRERLSKWEASSLCAKRIDIEQEGKDG